MEQPPAWLTGVETPEIAPLPEAKSANITVFLTDVPDKHWAKAAVYDLLNMGITQGYPDGTFRGEKSITRYETALFLSRMSDFIAVKKSGDLKARQKFFDENYAPKLKAELDDIKKEIEKMSQPETPRPEYGYFEGRLRVADLTALGNRTQTQEVAGGPVFDYRLKMQFAGDINKWLYGEANLDTMDVGWGGGPQRGLSEGLIDAAARAKTPYGFETFFTVGPGPVTHTEEAGTHFPSENGVTFLRPRNSFGADGNFFGVDLLASYSVLEITRTGEGLVSNFEIKVGYDFDEDLSPFGLSEISSTVDYDKLEGNDLVNAAHEKMYISFKPKWGFELELAGGLSSAHYSIDNYYYELGMKFKDLLRKGMAMEVAGVRVMKDYLNSPNYLAEEAMLGIDYFDKLRDIPGGGVNMGMKITYDASPVTRLRAAGVFVLDDELSYGEDRPGTHSTFEIGIDYVTFTYSTFGFVYRVYHKPSLKALATSDEMALDVKYAF